MCMIVNYSARSISWQITLISVLYYLYCNEMWNQLDGLTGLLSQKSYLNRTLNLQPEMSSASCSGNRRRKNTAGRNFTGS